MTLRIDILRGSDCGGYNLFITDVGSETQRGEDRKKRTSDSERGWYHLGKMTCSEGSRGLCWGQSRDPRGSPNSPSEARSTPGFFSGDSLPAGSPSVSSPPRARAVLLGPNKLFPFTQKLCLPDSSAGPPGSSPAWPVPLESLLRMNTPSLSLPSDSSRVQR